MPNTQFIKDLEWLDGVTFTRPEEFEITGNSLIQRKDIEEFDCSEYETEVSGGKAFRFKQRIISDDLFDKITDYFNNILDNTIMENQLDMMDAIADMYMAIEESR